MLLYDREVLLKNAVCVFKKYKKSSLLPKKAGKRVADEDAQTACSSACPTNAIVFGDVNDDTHQVQTLKKDPRAYKLLEHLNTDPSVFYQTKIRNKA
jgi:molybdopterin-containing oxidoreductase family iron-sulfur binding subunit